MDEQTRICRACEYTTNRPDEVWCPRCAKPRALIPLAVHEREPRDMYLGSVLGGRYPLLDLVGRGGMGAVYRSEQPGLNRSVAVKVILPQADFNATEARQRFLLEAQTIARLDHHGIVRVHDIGVELDGTIYMVQEFVHGKTLHALFQDGGFTVRQLIAIMLACLAPLAEAHAHQVIHRDIKPANIMLVNPDASTRGLRIKLLDFGLVKLMGANTQLSSASTVAGTPAYMSPEQMQGLELDPRTDLYSLGLVLFEGLAGRQPIVCENPIELARQRVTLPPPDLPDAAHISPELRQFMRTALAVLPEKRFQSADAMAAALQKVPLGQDADWPLPSRKEFVIHPSAQRPTWTQRPGFWAGGLAGLVACGLVVALVFAPPSDFWPAAGTGTGTGTGTRNGTGTKTAAGTGNGHEIEGGTGAGSGTAGTLIRIGLGEPGGSRGAEGATRTGSGMDLGTGAGTGTGKGAGGSGQAGGGGGGGATNLTPNPERSPPWHRLESRPSGALILDDSLGLSLGKTPKSMPARPVAGARIRYRIELQGYKSEIVELPLDGKQYRRTIVLKPKETP